MFARLVEFRVISDDAALEFLLTVEKKALPIIKAQPGCIDAFVLVPGAGRHMALGLSLWKSKAEAEQFRREAYTEVEQMLRPLLKRKPTVSTFRVL